MTLQSMQTPELWDSLDRMPYQAFIVLVFLAPLLSPGESACVWAGVSIICMIAMLWTVARRQQRVLKELRTRYEDSNKAAAY